MFEAFGFPILEHKIPRSYFLVEEHLTWQCIPKLCYTLQYLHVDDIFIKESKLFFVIDDKEYIYDKYKTIVVRNSFGKKQKRFSISTKMILGEKHYKIHISLTNRKKMKYPVLIGRRFLRKFEYIVNVKRKNINDRTKTL